MSLHDSIFEAHQKLARNVAIYLEAYIFVLEAEGVAVKNLNSDEHEDLSRSIQGSYLRLNSVLEFSNLRSTEYYRGILFIGLISNVEMFFSELVKAILIQYPQKVGSEKFELKDILNGVTVDELIERSAEERIYHLMYEKPEEYLKKICELLSIKVELISPFWPSYIEAKARRDLGVHNDWVCNDTYFRKASIEKTTGSPKIGDVMIPLDRKYCESVTHNILLMSDKFVEAIMGKHS